MIEAKIIITNILPDGNETVVKMNIQCLEITLGKNLETITLSKCKVVK